MNLTITGYSTALFSTWYFVEELGLLFDCGDGLMSGLLQKSRKIEHVFISHADRDHLTGLLQFNQLNARKDFPVIHYPSDCGSFVALEHFSQKFDPQSKGTIWEKIDAGEKVWIKKDIYVEAIRNNHVPCEIEVHKSLGYKVVQVKAKLKQEYTSLQPLEIKALIEKLGRAQTHDTKETILLSYSGDTPCENFEHWEHSNILIHEATFLGGAEDDHIQTHGNRHSKLGDVMKSVAESNIKCLILGHFSSRYSEEEIDKKINEYRALYNLSIPIFRVMPGQIVRNILNPKGI